MAVLDREEVRSPPIMFAFTPDSKRVLIGYGNTKVSVFNVSSGKPLFTIDPQNEPIIVGEINFSLSVDGSILIGAGSGAVGLWDMQTGERLKLFRENASKDAVTAMLSPDNKMLIVINEDAELEWWEFKAETRLRTIKSNLDVRYFARLTFSPDGKLVLARGANMMHIFDVATGRSLYTIDGSGAVAFSQDSRTLVTGTWNNLVRRWDARIGVLKVTMEGHTVVLSGLLTVSPNGKYLLTGDGDVRVKLWDIQTGKEIYTIKEIPSPDGIDIFDQYPRINGLAISPDNQTFSVTTFDRNTKTGEWQIHDLRTGKLLRTFRFDETALRYEIEYSTDGKSLFTFVEKSEDNPRMVVQRAIQTGKIILSYEIPEAIHSFIVLADDKTILSNTDDEITLQVLGSDDPPQVLAKRESGQSRFSDLTLSPDQKTVVLSLDDDKSKQLWDIELKWLLATISLEKGKFTSEAFSPDGKVLLLATADSHLLLYNVRSGKLLREINAYLFDPILQEIYYTRAIFMPDGQHILMQASGFVNDVVSIWDSQTGQLVKPLCPPTLQYMLP